MRMTYARGYRGWLPLFLLPVLLSCEAHRTPLDVRVATERAIRDVDSELAVLRPVPRRYPSRVSSEEQRQQGTRRWKDIEAALNELAAAECVAHFERAIALQPDYVDAYLELGIFYIDAGPRWAPLAEANLKHAIELSTSTGLPRGWRALAFAYYYQDQFADSVAAANEYLSLEPADDNDFLKLKSLAQQAASRGADGLRPVGRVVIP